MIRKLLFIQLMIGVLLGGLSFGMGWSLIAFGAGFLFAQIYSFLFLYLSLLLFKKRGRTWLVALIILKWPILVYVLYELLNRVEPRGFMLSLVSLVSFFVAYALLERKQ